MEVNYLSDLLIEVPFTDDTGASCDVPAFDFEFEYFVEGCTTKVVASQKNGVLFNCRKVDNILVCTFDNPRLGRGKLRSRKIYHIPDDRFNDGEYTLVVESNVDVTIV